jgi:type II secretory pathway pseudopilin PulG
MKTFSLNSRRAFSLVEVVVAVGIFALAIVGVIGLLSPTTKAVSDVSDNDAATRVVAAVQQGIQQIARAGFFVSSGSTIGVGSSTFSVSDGFVQSAAPTDPVDGITLATNTSLNKYVLYASKDGETIGVYNSSIWAGKDSSGTTYTATSTTANGRKFFEIVLIRNTDLSKNDAAATADSSAGYIAYTMRLRWPAFLPNGEEAKAHSQKNVMIVPAAVIR